MNRGRDRRQVKLDDQQHYKELEESHDAKASERFHTPAFIRAIQWRITCGRWE